MPMAAVGRTEQSMTRILAISGSLRAASSNTALLRAAVRLAPDNIEITVYDGLGRLPPFNPDLDGSEPPAVMDFRDRVQSADGVLFACPEYAHGVPGVLKNALDWVVASPAFVDKPVALINAAPRATHAQASLSETLATMSAILVSETPLIVSLAGKKLDADGIVTDPDTSSALRSAIATLARAVDMRRTALAH